MVRAVATIDVDEVRPFNMPVPAGSRPSTEWYRDGHPAIDRRVSRVKGVEGQQCGLSAGTHLLRIATGERTTESLRDGVQLIGIQGGEHHTPLSYHVYRRVSQIVGNAGHGGNAGGGMAIGTAYGFPLGVLMRCAVDVRFMVMIEPD